MRKLKTLEKVVNALRARFRSEEGQTVLEYVLLAAFVGLLASLLLQSGIAGRLIDGFGSQIDKILAGT